MQMKTPSKHIVPFPLPFSFSFSSPFPFLSPFFAAAEVLGYSIYECSGYSANYKPENVRRNEPNDQASRWSSAANDQNQFLTLKLDALSLLHTVAFGKFHKVHVCNLKEFRVFGGPSLDSLQLLIHAGLDNDSEPELFIPAASASLPVRFVKIVPIAAWGSNFNFSIWHVELRGLDDPEILFQASAHFTAAQELRKTRAILKYLRDRPQFAPAYTALQDCAQLQLEASAVSHLRQMLLDETATLAQAEQLIDSLYTANPGIFDEHLSRHVPWTAHWTRLDRDRDRDRDGSALLESASGSAAGLLDENGDYRMASTATLPMPSPRGGHQMVWDSTSRSLWLFGGWDGNRDLGDLWRCRVPLIDADGPMDSSSAANSLAMPNPLVQPSSFMGNGLRWELVSADVRAEGGPCPRSCHKAVLHTRLRRMYVLGRYLEPDSRTAPANTDAIPNDFFCYHLDAARWELVSADVRSQSGPPCIYDHQMAIDEDSDTLWVFGGRVLGASDLGGTSGNAGNGSASAYSGLYRYEIRTNRWSLVRPDQAGTGPLHIPDTLPIPSRIGHSMLFDSRPRQGSEKAGDSASESNGMLSCNDKRSLIILAGQRNKDYLADWYRYNVDTDTVWAAGKNIEAAGGPEAGFTQRAVIDPLKREVYLFAGLTRSGTGSNTASTAGTDESSACFFWTLNLELDRWTPIAAGPGAVPCARFAHQLAYDPSCGLVFLFGGNPGSPSTPGARLGDFWLARLRKHSRPIDILRQCRYRIRALQFERLVAAGSAVEAVRFLQGPLAEVVDHTRPDESAAFRALSTKLFARGTEGENGTNNGTVSAIAAFEEIVRFLPASMQPPFDLVQL